MTDLGLPMDQAAAGSSRPIFPGSFACGHAAYSRTRKGARFLRAQQGMDTPQGSRTQGLAGLKDVVGLDLA